MGKKTASRKERDRSVKCSDVKPEVLAELESRANKGKCLACGLLLANDKQPDRAKRCDCSKCTNQFYGQRKGAADKFNFELRAINDLKIAPKDFKHRRKNAFSQYAEAAQ